MKSRTFKDNTFVNHQPVKFSFFDKSCSTVWDSLKILDKVLPVTHVIVKLLQLSSLHVTNTCIIVFKYPARHVLFVCLMSTYSPSFSIFFYFRMAFTLWVTQRNEISEANGWGCHHIQISLLICISNIVFFFFLFSLLDINVKDLNCIIYCKKINTLRSQKLC